MEKAALSDEYFIKRKLYPNVDFYSGLIYRYTLKTSVYISFEPIVSGVDKIVLVIRAMGFPTEFFPVLFAIPRMAGYLAH